MLKRGKHLYIGDFRVNANILRYYKNMHIKSKNIKIHYGDFLYNDKQNNDACYRLFGIFVSKVKGKL